MLLGSLAPAALMAQESPVKVTAAWSRATTASATSGVAYLTVTVSAPDRIIGVSTPEAAMADLHQTRMANGVMEMRPTGPVDVVPGTPLQLKPGSFHIMLMGLAKPLRPGDHFPITLTFAKAGPVTADVMVGTAGASTPPAAAPP